MSESNEDDLVLALGPVVQTLQSLNVPFYVGGSVASSYHGAVRSTMDVDLVCELTDDQVVGFASVRRARGSDAQARNSQWILHRQ